MNAFRTSRHFTVPPAAVFAVIADPVRLARWWGPDGFTNTFQVCAFVTGGAWSYTMHGPNGMDYTNVSVFAEIVPDARVRIRHTSKPEYELTIDLASEAGGTRLTWEQVFASAAVAQSIRHIVEPANEQNLDRLGREVLAPPHPPGAPS